MQLSKNFTLREMTRSQTATRKGIDNNPTGTHQSNLVLLCQNILQPLRDYFGRPLRVTSGYRSPDLCKILNSKITSQHCANNGAAADFEIFGYDNKEVASHIKNNFEFDQLILEYYDSSDINSGWIHCSFKSGANRKESLTKDKAGYQKWE